MFRTASDLPHELLLECFEQVIRMVFHEPERTKRLAFLLDYALVCRSWTAPAQAMLFREVKFPENLDGPEQGIRPFLLRFLDHMRAHAARGSPLPHAVMSIALKLGVAPSFDYDARVDVDEIDCDLITLVTVPKALPNLVHLSLTTSSGWIDFERFRGDPEKAHLVQDKFTSEQMRELKDVVHVSALSLSITEFDMPLFAQLLAAFPNLTYLDIQETYHVEFTPDTLAAPGADDLSNLASLRELRVATPQTAATLAARAPLQIETLHVKELGSLSELSAFRSTLRKLVVSDWRGMPKQAAAPTDTEYFPQLTTLCISGINLPNNASLGLSVGISPVAHVGLMYEPSRLPLSKELVKLFDDLLGPPGSLRSIRSAAVYSSSAPHFLSSGFPRPEELQTFEVDRGFPIVWSDDIELFGIPGVSSRML